MEKSELKALYIKRMEELQRKYYMSKNQALRAAFRPLINEVTPLHNSHMAAAIHVGMVHRGLESTGEYKKKKGRK